MMAVGQSPGQDSSWWIFRVGGISAILVLIPQTLHLIFVIKKPHHLHIMLRQEEPTDNVPIDSSSQGHLTIPKCGLYHASQGYPPGPVEMSLKLLL